MHLVSRNSTKNDQICRKEGKFCLQSFRALTIYTPRLSCLKRPQHLSSVTKTWGYISTHLSRQPRHVVLSSRVDPSATFFTDFSTRPFPFLLEFDLWNTCFVEPHRAFFSSGDNSTTLSDDFDTVWPSGDFCHHLDVFYVFSDDVYVPTVLSRYSVMGAFVEKSRARQQNRRCQNQSSVLTLSISCRFALIIAAP